jgi:hypothetical protein
MIQQQPEGSMPDATMAIDVARPAVKSAGGPVLVVGGRASAGSLLSLARWTGAGADRLHVLVPGERTADHGAEAVQRLLDGEQGGAWALMSGRLLDAIAATRANSVVIGYPADAEGRADFALAVQRIRAEVDVDVIVCFERHQRPWRRVLVPYLSATLDGAALRIAERSGLEVTLLHAVESLSSAEATVRPAMADHAGCTLRVVQTHDPLSAAADEARSGYDVVLIGGGQGVLHGRPFTMRQQRLLLGTDLSLVVVYSAG